MPKQSAKSPAVPPCASFPSNPSNSTPSSAGIASTAGGKTRLGRITKQGDKYLRTLLIHGTRAVLAALRDKQDRTLPAAADKPGCGRLRFIA